MSCRALVAALALSSLAAACGGARTTTATTTSGTTTTTTSPEPVADAAPPPDAPCTSWDPSADPTLAPADVAGPPDTARRGASGLRFCILREGEGARPGTDDTVLVHYSGWTTDGHMFDSSHTRGAPVRLAVSGVIAGWTQALTHMRVGEVRRLWIPESLAYRGQAGAPAGMLVFDVELVDIDR